MRAVNGVADDQVLDGLTLEQTSTQIRHLEQSWARWQELHHLMMGMEGNDAAAEAAERIHVEVEQQVLASVARLEAQLRRRRDEHAPAAVAVPVPVAQAVIVRHHREPRIGQFDGKHENWASFFDLFRVEVDGREDMDPLEKLVYLKAACIGQGAKALGDWPTTADNYALAWESLREKFNDPYVTKNRLITDIQRMPRQREESYDGLRTLIDTPKIALRQLMAMGVDVGGLDLQIMNTVLYKAPDGVMDAWEQQRGGAEPTLEQLFAWLEKRARSRMVSESMNADRNRWRNRNQEKGREKDNGQAGRRQDNGQGGRRQDNGQAGRSQRQEKGKYDHDQGHRNQDNQDNGQPAVSDNGQPGKGGDPRPAGRGGNRPNNGPLRCWICGDTHSMYACHTLLSKGIKERMALMQEKGVCLECGRPHVGNCRWPRQCELCANEKHTELVCPKRGHEGGKAVEVNGRKRKPT